MHSCRVLMWLIVTSSSQRHRYPVCCMHVCKILTRHQYFQELQNVDLDLLAEKYLHH